METTEYKNLDGEVHFSGKNAKKGETAVQPPDPGNSNSWVCKNSACKALLSPEDAFCKRCSCCICHQFDDNKDPTLWLVCGSESGSIDSCGLSCHVECAIQCRRAGILNLRDSLHIDASYCCASCGKVSGILGFWKKQLVIARDARRVDILCHRISLSYRLLEGTLHFQVLHEVVCEAKAKLETEVGPVSGVSAKMARGIVSRLSVASDVQRLCSLAIDEADRWLSLAAGAGLDGPSVHWDSLPAACRFHFEDITSSTVVIVLKETSSSSEGGLVEGYKLWYGKSGELEETEMAAIVFPETQRRILIANLQPCTEYTFKIISFAESGDLGYSESRCFTRSVELQSLRNVANRRPNQRWVLQAGSRRRETKGGSSGGFRIRNLGKILRLAWAHEHGGPEGCWADSGQGGLEGDRGNPSTTVSSCGLNLNVLSALGMNPEVLASLGGTEASNGSGDNKDGGASEDSLNWATHAGSSGEDTRKLDGDEDANEHDDEDDDDFGTAKKRRVSEDDAHDEMEYDGDSTLVNGSPPRPMCGGRLDDRYEDCVKIVRWLECKGHVGRDFRMKFLTWFSLRSTEQERRVVHTYIDTLVDDPASLAGQLVHSFSAIVACKRLKEGGSCTELCTAVDL